MNTATAALKPPMADEGVLPFGIPVELTITDPELIRELLLHPEGKDRDDYAFCAFKIGVLALKQARGQVDEVAVRQAGEHLLDRMKTQLELHATGLNSQLSSALREYFDPRTGRFQERVERLVAKDGELEQVLRRHVGQQDSEMCRTLLAHFGTESPLMKVLSPRESEGLLRMLGETLGSALTEQRNKVLEQFSLDQPDSALSRLVDRLAHTHGLLGKDLGAKVEELQRQFSLNEKNSALAQMVEQISTTSQKIDEHLTLDRESSALSRLRGELLKLLEKQGNETRVFQEEVKVTLAAFQARRQAAARAPEHGRSFEERLFDFIQKQCQESGDVASCTGSTTGLIKNCKLGDVVVELGPEHVAAGAKIVIEAKDKAGYTLAAAREEIEQARKNRGAALGVFVFARGNAPVGLEPFQRLGDDLFLTWDAEDPSTDVLLQAGLMVTRALCARQAKARSESAADFEGIEKNILAIEKEIEHLAEIETAANTIKTGSEKILKRVDLSRSRLKVGVEALRQLTDDLKQCVRAEA